jgi:hypothetical protein
MIYCKSAEPTVGLGRERLEQKDRVYPFFRKWFADTGLVNPRVASWSFAENDPVRNELAGQMTGAGATDALLSWVRKSAFHGVDDEDRDYRCR